MITNAAAHTRYRDEQFSPVPIAQTDRTKVMIVSFEPGQFIPVHRPGVDLTFVVLDGTGTLVAGGDEREVGPGTIAFAAAGEARGVKAHTRMRLLSVVTPPPSEADHADVRAGLRRGSWRPEESAPPA